MRKRRHREVKCCAQGHTAGWLQSKGSELGFLTPHVLFVQMLHSAKWVLSTPWQPDRFRAAEKSTLCLTRVLGAENRSLGRNVHNSACCVTLCVRCVSGTLHSTRDIAQMRKLRLGKVKSQALQSNPQLVSGIT